MSELLRYRRCLLVVLRRGWLVTAPVGSSKCHESRKLSMSIRMGTNMSKREQHAGTIIMWRRRRFEVTGASTLSSVRYLELLLILPYVPLKSSFSQVPRRVRDTRIGP